MRLGVIGVGTDIIEIERIKKAYLNRGERFLNRIYTPDEIAFCMQRNNPWPCLAARFAAKEAVFKALKTGVTDWHEVEVCGGGNKPVKIILTGKAEQEAVIQGINSVLLSIAHDRGRAVAFATAASEEV